ncbi:MAG: DUF4433 domain-containing protein [Deltaproteobacteria bacterium]|nr:DUF4433 domain-containing protein [Deltaproteobacteria bacterium]
MQPPRYGRDPDVYDYGRPKSTIEWFSDPRYGHPAKRTGTSPGEDHSVTSEPRVSVDDAAVHHEVEAAPSEPKVYHIVHLDRLASIVKDGHLWSDATMATRQNAGTTVGMSKIKARRLTNKLTCYPDLAVGDCVPFYFCPRSVMLYLIYRGNDADLAYQGGQEPIVHLEADLHAAVKWAKKNGKRWAFTLSNAGANYFEDRNDLGGLGEIDWDGVAASKWSGNGVSPTVKEGKQAEFLVEECFPWTLVERIGVIGNAQATQVMATMAKTKHRPPVEVRRDWYY